MAVIEAEIHIVEQVEQQAAFDYAQIDEAVRDEVQAAARSIHQLSKGVVTGIIAIGQRLIEVKGMLPHGQFIEWVLGEFSVTERTAQNYMNVAREYGNPQKRNTISLFSPTVAYLLAAPSTPDEARTEVEQAAARGEKVTVEFAREAVRKAKPEPEPEMPRHLARAGYQLMRARNGDTDTWGWQWQVDIPGSGDGLGKDGDRHIGPWVAQPLDAIQGATEHHARRQATARQGARAVYVEPAPADSSVEPGVEEVQLITVEHSELTPPDLVVAGYTILVRGYHQQGDFITVAWGWIRRGSYTIDEYKQQPLGLPVTRVMGGRRDFDSVRVAIEEARRDMIAGAPLGRHERNVPTKHEPTVMPADLVAAGYALVGGDGDAPVDGKYGYRWKLGDEMGPNVAYGGAAIEGARFHHDATFELATRVAPAAPTAQDMAAAAEASRRVREDLELPATPDAPHTLPDDLTAAGFQLIQPRQGAWAILRETGPIPFESDWRMEADIDLAIEEARAFLGESAYNYFEEWLSAAPREPSLRECLAVLEYAKRIVGRVRALEPSLDALVGAVLPPWSQLVNAVEKKVKRG